MRFEKFSFGSIRIDGVTYEHDVVIDRGEIHKRKKKPSKKFRAAFMPQPVPEHSMSHHGNSGDEPVFLAFFEHQFLEIDFRLGHDSFSRSGCVTGQLPTCPDGS